MKLLINTEIHKSKKGFAFQLESFRTPCNRDRREGGGWKRKRKIKEQQNWKKKKTKKKHLIETLSTGLKRERQDKAS